jgi:tetratricopeptide (TPR) repeat protein
MATLDEFAQAGIAAINDKRFDEAIANFRQALALDATRPDLTNALGMAYLHRGEAATAIPFLEQAVALAEPFTGPDVQQMKLHFHLGLATAYELLDRTGDARRVLEGAVLSWPESLPAQLQLAQVLLASCAIEAGVAAYQRLADHPELDDEGREAALAVAGAVEAFLESDHPAGVFLRGHQETYQTYFGEVSRAQLEAGWYAEAARMARGPDGEPRPSLAAGARPYALTRVDLVNPATGEMASVHSEQDPMVVALNGFEPLAQIAVMLPWKGLAFPTWVCSRCPWHWLPITVQFEAADAADALIDAVDPVIGDWYLAGFNGEFGDRDSGRFHYVTDPEVVGDRAVSYTVDLGRASYDAVEALLRKLTVLHDRRPIRRVLFGQGKLPD